MSGQTSYPNLIITDANVISMNPTGQFFTSVGVKGDVITHVTNDTLNDYVADNQIKKINLGGRTLLPGFIDSHSHWIGDRDRLGLTADEVIEAALSSGWTTISEQFVNQDRLNELISLDTENRLKLRVNAFLPVNYQEQRFGDWYKAYNPHEIMSKNVRIGGVKLFMDNGPYFSNIGRNHWFTPTELNPIVKTIHDLGYQISIHSFIDNATDTALNAIEAAQGNNSVGLYRHRIEHAAFLRDDQLLRLDQMNIIVSAQIYWYNSDWAETIFNDAALDTIPNLHTIVGRWRDVIDQGLRFIGSTDTPWGWTYDTVSAIKGLHSITTRIGEAGLTPPAWMLDQRITIEEGLKSITIDGAYGNFEEDVKGSVEVGKLADFVVLSDNPLEIPASEFRDLSVVMTMIGGEVVYCAKGLETMCNGVYQVTESMDPSSSAGTTDSTPSTRNSINTSSSTGASLPLYSSFLLIIVLSITSKKKRELNERQI